MFRLESDDIFYMEIMQYVKNLNPTNQILPNV